MPSYSCHLPSPPTLQPAPHIKQRTVHFSYPTSSTTLHRLRSSFLRCRTKNCSHAAAAFVSTPPPPSRHPPPYTFFKVDASSSDTEVENQWSRTSPHPPPPPFAPLPRCQEDIPLRRNTEQLILHSPEQKSGSSVGKKFCRQKRTYHALGNRASPSKFFQRSIRGKNADGKHDSGTGGGGNQKSTGVSAGYDRVCRTENNTYGQPQIASGNPA